MTVSVAVYQNPYDMRFGSDSAKFSKSFPTKSLRIQKTKIGDMVGYILGESLISDGVYVTDVEHDNAWLFRMELCVTDVDIHSWSTTVIRGMVVEASFYEDESEAFKGLEECSYCTDDYHRHKICEYCPPRQKLNGFVEIIIHQD